MRTAQYGKGKEEMILRGLFLIITAVAVTLLSSCRQDGTPKSGGAPYEVVVCGDSTLTHTVDSFLTIPFGSLPQNEPSFDVTVVNALNAMTALARNIVMVTRGDTAGDSVRITYSKNVSARPQMTITMTFPASGNIPVNISSAANTVRMLLNRAEMNAMTAMLSRTHNTEADKTARDMFTFGISVPAEMKWSKRGYNFLWLSDNSPQAMKNVCLFTVPAGNDTTPGRMIHISDSVMGRNIKGETDSMMFTTSRHATVSVEHTLLREQRITVMRGLWEMTGYAMGGPFVCHIWREGDTLYFAEAFVFAPGRKKRNLIQTSQAALFTIKKK